MQGVGCKVFYPRVGVHSLTKQLIRVLQCAEALALATVYYPPLHHCSVAVAWKLALALLPCIGLIVNFKQTYVGFFSLNGRTLFALYSLLILLPYCVTFVMVAILYAL